MNPRIAQLNTDSATVITNIININTDISNLIQGINNNAESASPVINNIVINSSDLQLKIEEITSDELGFGELSDKIANRGKDILLIADQAEQFICISNDTFSRVVDVYIYLNSLGVNNKILDALTLIYDKALDIKDYLSTRTSNLTISEVIDTKTAVESIETELQTLITDYESVSNSLSNLASKSLNIISTFQNVLAVNAAVGVALSVSKRAEEELILMNNQPYEITEIVKPLVTENERSIKILDNGLMNANGIGNMHLKFLKFLPQLFLEDSLISSEFFDYNIIKKIDLVPKDPKVGNEFRTLSQSEIDTLPRNLPVQLESLFGQVAFFEDLDTSDASLQSFYDTIIDPSITFLEFKELFNDNIYLELFNKFQNGVSSIAIDEYIISYKKYLQTKMLETTLQNYNISSDGVLYDDEFILNDTLYKGDIENLNFHIYLNQFFKTKYSDYNGSLSSFTKIEQMKIDYKDLHIPDTLRLKQQSGNLKIKQMKDGLLTKNISNFDYNFKIYEDGVQIYYAEAIVNDIKFVIKNGVLVLVYNIKTETSTNIELVTSEDKTILTEYKIDGYLINNNAEHTLSLIDYHEDNIKNISLKKDGQEIEQIIEIDSEYDVNAEDYNVTRTIEETETNTTYISNSPVDRIATNITNIYRTELIEDRLDFPQARVRSMVSALQHLGYRKVLDDYITLTWDLGIPHPKRGD